MKEFLKKHWSLLRWVLTFGIFAVLLSTMNLRELGARLATANRSALAIAVGIQLANLCLGTLRFSWVLRACGADQPVPPLELVRVYFQGFFYNTFLPGGVGGDVVRGVVTRHAFSNDGMVRSTSAVFLERVLGLAGLFFVVSFASALFPLVEGAAVLGLLAFAASIVGVIAFATISIWTAWLPQKIQRIIDPIRKKLPVVREPWFLALGVLLSVVIQSAVAVTGHVILSSQIPNLLLSDSMAVVPLANATAFLPITQGGAGARELVYASLLSLRGVSSEVAVAGSLLIFLSGAACAALCGAIAMFLPKYQFAKSDEIVEQAKEEPSNDNLA